MSLLLGIVTRKDPSDAYQAAGVQVLRAQEPAQVDHGRPVAALPEALHARQPQLPHQELVHRGQRLRPRRRRAAGRARRAQPVALHDGNCVDS